ncbi:hypothetical protein F8388_024842 [Cannabis sativa]|uniref:Ubiquitin-like protease family profile domain-containing protein n=1 Tax=Cannabis sativa TaxID=3483 RepID=A0A7J6I074_CANSA|nr:hypothetical protein F8388_024842 [Cannabis sativa]KAF4400388.1 hypothetical protein G4B88_018730 [Cannabis sativa]
MELVSSKNKLKEKCFKNMMSIKIIDVANALDSISREAKTRDRVKLCFIYFLSAFLIMPSFSSAIDLEWLQLFFVRPTLAPTSKEKAELFYERLDSYEDNEDGIIDQISSFLVGDVILRNQQCVAPHVDPPSSNVGQSNMEPPSSNCEPPTMNVEPPSSNFEPPTNDVEPPQFTQIPQQSHLHPSSQPPSSYNARNDLLELVKCLIDSPSHAYFFGDGFVTPPRERNMECGQVSTLPGEEVEQIVRDGRPLRLRKRVASLKSPFTLWPRKHRYSKLEPPTFDPFRQSIEEDVQAFFKWKRMDKFHNIFPKDICILTYEFGQRVRDLYKESREENNNVCKTNEELMMFVKDHWISIEAMKKFVEPLAAYFPFLLKNSCHIGSLHHQCSDLMSIKVALANIVPLNKRTRDCGIFMLKTMEMHIAGKSNESATMLLNDNNIDTFRKAYAVQLSVGSADP